MTTANPAAALAARRAAALERTIRFNGLACSRRKTVLLMLADNATIEQREGQRALVRPNGAYLLESQISKTALDYAQDLLEGASDPAPPPHSA